MIKILRATTITASALLLLAAAPASADLIVNGGFEDPQLRSGSWALFCTIPGWNFVGGEGCEVSGQIEIQNNVAGTPYEGNQFAELDSTRPTTLYQNVATEAGENYVLSFAFAARPGTNILSDNVMSVTWGGSEIFNLPAPNFTPDWTVFTLYVTASSNSTRLTFGDDSSNSWNSYGVYLDDVRLVAKVPEPSTLGLLGLGLLGLGLSRRRRS